MSLNQSLEQELETLEGFEAWLNRKKPSQIVGYARTACLCPLAEYLLDFCQLKVEVGGNGIAVDDGRLPHTPLTWQFTRWIDEWRTSRAPITAAQAIQALKAARETAKGGRT